MIQAAAPSKDGGTVVLLGLTRTNIERLLAGQPISVEGLNLGLPGLQIVVCAGETEDAIADEIKPLITEQTVVRDIRPTGGR